MLGLLFGAVLESARAEPVALNPRDPTQSTVGFLTYGGGVAIASRDGRFGGMSGLVVTPAGDLISVSDRGFWLIAAGSSIPSPTRRA